MLIAADKNKDSQFGEAEFLNFTLDIFRLQFDAMDVNKDGRISLDEFKAANPQMTESVAREIFKMTDANQDGQLSFFEFLSCMIGV